MMLFDTLSGLDRLSPVLFSAVNDAAGPMTMPMDLHREPDRYVLDADLPGVDPKSIELSVDGQWLTIRAERSTKSETQDGQWLVRERSDASVLRRIALDQDANVDAIEANYHDGVLNVVIPLAGDRHRKIQVASGQGAQQALGAGAVSQSEDTAAGKAQPAHSVAS